MHIRSSVQLLNKNAVVFLLMLFSSMAYGQSAPDANRAKLVEAVKLVDKGQIDSGITILKDLQKLEPENYSYNYELAYALLIKKDFQGVADILEKLRTNKGVTDLVYQLLGNDYDLMGNPDKAIETYEAGLKLFPGSGKLHLELGIMNLKKNDYDNALAHFENGIIAEPKFPSNYYWATKMFFNTKDEVWGMIYGEIFMNLESNTDRTGEISKLLYNKYKSEIVITPPNKTSVSFSENAAPTEKDKAAGRTSNFSKGTYEKLMLLSAAGSSSVSLNSLDTLRTNFLKHYFEEGAGKTYPNALFTYQKKVFDAGHLESYNHWILQAGDQETFKTWVGPNKGKWDAFIKWFAANRLTLDNASSFYRTRY